MQSFIATSSKAGLDTLEGFASLSNDGAHDANDPRNQSFLERLLFLAI